MNRGIWWLCALALVACDDGGEATTVDSGAVTDAGETLDGAPPEGDAAVAADQGTPPPTYDPDCDPIMPSACTFPWPSSAFLAADADRATGYTLTFGPTSLPANSAGVHIDPTPYRRMDGYGVGTPIMVYFAGLDPTPFATEASIEESLAADAPLLLFEVTDAGHRRVPYWAEMDAFVADQQALLVRPAEILRPATRYVVAFRDLSTTDGEPIVPSEAFAAYRDGVAAGALSTRAQRFDELFAILDAEGVDRGRVTLAWDFVTASSEALHGRMLQMWDDAIERLGSDGPTLVFDEVEEYLAEDDGSGQPVNPYVALRIKGHVEVPHYLRQVSFLGIDGWFLNADADWVITPDGTREAPFWISVPHGALDGTPHGLIKHGHGMFGDGKDAADLGWTRLCGAHPPRECGWFHGRVDQQHQFITFASDLIGMSAYDEDTYAPLLISDLTYFPWIGDRLHQGLLEWLLVTRAMKTQLGAMPDLVERGVVVNAEEVFYWGISQGAIFGPSFVALSPDVQRGVFSVAGVNYISLVERSANFEPFFNFLAAAYPNRHDQVVAEATIQLLWDGTDGVSYIRHVAAEPLPDRQPAQMLVDVTRGDYQVAPVTMEVAARSDLELRVMANYDADRTVPLVDEQPYPHSGSGLINWSFGNAWAHPGNRPPGEDDPDPHEYARHMDAMNRQMAHFFRTGEIIDVCAGAPCPDLSDVESP